MDAESEYLRRSRTESNVESGIKGDAASDIYIPDPRSERKYETQVGEVNPYYGKTESLHYDHEETLLWRQHIIEKYEYYLANLRYMLYQA